MTMKSLFNLLVDIYTFHKQWQLQNLAAITNTTFTTICYSNLLNIMNNKKTFNKNINMT
jgi:hypothetical protein